MAKKTKYKIEVREKAARYGDQGKLIETIMRIPWMEQMGDLSPLFCRYREKKC
jgi:hypothetical protein